MATAQDPTRPHEPTREFHRYDRGPHFVERVECDRRPITKALAREAVECGTVEDNPVDRPYEEYRFRHEVDGLEVVVAAGESKAPGVGLRIFTAFVDVEDPNRAWASDTWSGDEIEVATLLQCLTAGHSGAVRKYPLASVDIEDAVPYHGHDLVCNQGYDTAYCLRCNHSSIDGDVFDRRPCY